MNLYLDASALTKRYLEEDGSSEVVSLLSADHVVGSAAVTLAEVTSAFRRAALGGRVSEEAASLAREACLADQGGIVWFNVTRSSVALASTIAWRHALRGFDAIHLSSAMRWADTLGEGRGLIFATFDQRLAEAARAEGLAAWP
jgi:predicted nucleic acid-binding protein